MTQITVIKTTAVIVFGDSLFSRSYGTLLHLSNLSLDIHVLLTPGTWHLKHVYSRRGWAGTFEKGAII